MRLSKRFLSLFLQWTFLMLSFFPLNSGHIILPLKTICLNFVVFRKLSWHVLTNFLATSIPTRQLELFFGKKMLNRHPPSAISPFCIVMKNISQKWRISLGNDRRLSIVLMPPLLTARYRSTQDSEGLSKESLEKEWRWISTLYFSSSIYCFAWIWKN